MFAMPDLTHFKNGVKFGIGFAFASLITVWLLLEAGDALTAILHANEKQTFKPDVEIQSLNHWIRDDELVFAGKVVNKSSINWKSLDIAFIATDANGKTIGRCNDTLYEPRFWGTTITFEAVCEKIPPGLTNYKYEISIYGRY